MSSLERQVRVGVACFIYKDGRFIMQQRAGAHGEGTWSVPGGNMEYSETPEACAAREVLEETGVTIRNVTFLTLTNDVFTDKIKHYITLWMTAEWFAGEPTIMEPDKCSAIGWFDFDSLPQPLFEPCWQNLRAAKPELFQ